MTEKCKHQYALKESKKQRAEMGSWGSYPSKDWKRVDIYYYIFCLDEQIMERRASVMEFPDREPDWW